MTFCVEKKLQIILLQLGLKFEITKNITDEPSKMKNNGTLINNVADPSLKNMVKHHFP